LVNDDDARRQGGTWRPQAARFAVNEKLAAIRLIDTAEDLDQRRFTGAVLAHNSMNFARHNVEANVVENAIADKRLPD
jgi:hypothetical protein